MSLLRACAAGRLVRAGMEVHGGAVAGVASARGQWRSRRGLLLRLVDEDGRVGLGEASPLPGYSPDTLDACRAALAWLPAWLAARPAAQRAGAISAAPDLAGLGLAAGGVRAPAARFALETAVVDLLGQRLGWPMWRCLRALGGVGLPAQTQAWTPGPVALNAVCTDADPARALDAVARAYARGIRCFKLKAGRDFARELALLEAVRAAYGASVALRVDVNQAWTPDQARDRLARLAPLAVEYVEEPVAQPAENLAALAPLPVPVALDESLAGPGAGGGVASAGDWLEPLLARGLVSVLVLKPMLLGGLAACMALAARARRHGAGVVVSHLFDGPVALAVCAQLALALDDGSTGGSRACGLDRHAGLDAWGQAMAIPYLHADRIVPPASPGLGLEAEAEADSDADPEADSEADSDADPEADSDAEAAQLAQPTAKRPTQSAAAHVLSIRAAAADAPGRVALIHRGHAHTFAELAERTRPVMDAVEQYAAQQGHTPASVALAVDATPTLDTALVLYAALAQGITCVLLHHRSTAAEQGARLALCRELAPDARGRVVVFTSGTSGSEKGVVLSSRALLASAAGSASNLGWLDDDRWLCCLPLAHVGGLSILVRCLVGRRCAVLDDGAHFDPDRIAASIATHRVTLVSLVPTMLARLLDAGWSPPGHLRAVLLGGAAAPPALLARAMDRGVPVLTTYGMSEACSQVCTQELGTRPSLDGRIGPPIPGAELRIARGRIQIRGPMLLDGYLGAPSPLDEDGWLETGDCGLIEADGALRVLGRHDETIITGGENVHPGEVEPAVAAHPAVAAACVFGIDDDTWGQVLAVAVVLRPEAGLAALPGGAHAEAAPAPGVLTPALLADDLARFLAPRLPAHKRPRRLAVVAQLALNRNGKVDRRQVAREAMPCLVAIDYRGAHGAI